VYQIFTTADGTANNNTGNPMNVVQVTNATTSSPNIVQTQVAATPIHKDIKNQP
jgi:hypothetical protein